MSSLHQICSVHFIFHCAFACGIWRWKGACIKKERKIFQSCNNWMSNLANTQNICIFLQGTHHHICVCAYLDPLNSDDGKLLSSFNHHASSRPKKKNTFWLQISYRHKYLFWHALLMLQPCLRPKGQNHTQTKIPQHCYRELLPHIHTPSKDILIQFREWERSLVGGLTWIMFSTKQPKILSKVALKENL